MHNAFVRKSKVGIERNPVKCTSRFHLESELANVAPCFTLQSFPRHAILLLLQSLNILIHYWNPSAIGKSSANTLLLRSMYAVRTVFEREWFVGYRPGVGREGGVPSSVLLDLKLISSKSSQVISRGSRQKLNESTGISTRFVSSTYTLQQTNSSRCPTCCMVP